MESSRNLFHSRLQTNWIVVLLVHKVLRRHRLVVKRHVTHRCTRLLLHRVHDRPRKVLTARPVQKSPHIRKLGIPVKRAPIQSLQTSVLPILPILPSHPPSTIVHHITNEPSRNRKAHANRRSHRIVHVARYLRGLVCIDRVIEPAHPARHKLARVVQVLHLWFQGLQHLLGHDEPRNRICLVGRDRKCRAPSHVLSLWCAQCIRSYDARNRERVHHQGIVHGQQRSRLWKRVYARIGARDKSCPCVKVLPAPPSGVIHVVSVPILSSFHQKWSRLLLVNSLSSNLLIHASNLVCISIALLVQQLLIVDDANCRRATRLKLLFCLDSSWRKHIHVRALDRLSTRMALFHIFLNLFLRSIVTRLGRA